MIVLVVVGPSAAGSGEPATWLSWLELLLCLLLLLAAVRQFRGRPRAGGDPPMPKWMGSIDRFKPVTSLGAGVALVAANPKNLLLAIGGAAAIAQTGISGGQQAIACGVFALIASIGVAVPLVLHFALGPRSAEMLWTLKDWMSHNNAVIMTVLCGVIGFKLIGDAIAGLTD